ncbi:iron chelate uptake ABC transporter family permease subunit [Streptomyces sp. SM11]|uniref:FecCD family ABC transporter permease n=1 Tax=Streptomyces sp. SM11 TaxID=565557 RepID=UPI000CD4C62A|nr:iron chelate uptake ABC transporter family permease subunit [Streptomyces sp. SM11]
MSLPTPPGPPTQGSSAPLGAAATAELDDARSGPRSAVPGRRPLRAGPLSAVWRPRQILVPLLIAAMLFGAVVVSTARGSGSLSAWEVALRLLGGGNPDHDFVIFELRLPRALIGVLVGGALGLAGAIIQGLARNPLASPDILGITSGAGAGAVTVIVLGGSYGSVSGPLADIGIPAAAVGGALIAAMAVYLLAVRRGISGYRVLLVGVGVNAVLGSVLSWLLVKADIADVGRALVWLNGSLDQGADWSTVRTASLVLAALVPVALALSFSFGALAYDEDTTRGLGVRMTGSRAALLLTAVLLTATATAAAGPVAFVALAAPQLALRLARTGTPPLLASGLLGAAVTVWADVLGRTTFGELQLPVGVLTAALGAPYLLYLLVRSGKARIS